MSIVPNGRGRSNAQCEGCDANVIDLGPRLDDSARVLRTFFGWSTSLARGAWTTRCPRCCRRQPEEITT